MPNAVCDLIRAVAEVLRREDLDRQAGDLERPLAVAIPPCGPTIGNEMEGRRGGTSAAAEVYLSAALEDVEAGGARGLAAPLALLRDCLHWTQTAARVAAPPHDRFLERYAHATILGSPPAVRVDPTRTAALGVLLLGPEKHYPHHHHPADEIYIPLTVATWSSGLHAPYRDLRPGRPLHHRPHQPHAIRIGHRPLLSIYLWTGDTTTPAQLMTR